jgi:hypothetical protein
LLAHKSQRNVETNSHYVDLHLKIEHNSLRVPILGPFSGQQKSALDGRSNLKMSRGLRNVNTASKLSLNSSKREEFRNRLKLSGGLSDYGPFNRFNREQSSASSRFVFKVDDNTSDAEFRLQAEAMN